MNERGIFGRAGRLIRDTRDALDDVAGVANHDRLVQRLAAYSNGRYVQALQIGANDGERPDLIQECIKIFNWRALLVEPVKSEAESLQGVFREQIDANKVRIVNAAVSGVDGTAPLYGLRIAERFRSDDENSNHLPPQLEGIESLSEDWLRAQVTKNAPNYYPGAIEPYAMYSVETYTVASLKRFLSMGDVFNVVSVNAAGLDGEVMSQALAMHPDYYVFNHSNMSPREQRLNAKGLAEQGYDLFKINRWLTFAALH